MSQREVLRPSEVAFASAISAGVVGIPVRSPRCPLLSVDIQAPRRAVESKGGRLAQPGQPRGFFCRLKAKLQLALRVQLIQALLLRPDERMKRYSGHGTFPVPALFLTPLNSSQHQKV